MPDTPQKETPMMRQYNAAKKQYPNSILFFRMGDFYEMFQDDAIEASRLLNLTLTRRDKKNNIPMCGIPYHAAETYIAKLLQLKKRIAICDQVEDPKKAKGIVKRQVVRVITPATTFDEKQLPDRANNFLVSIYIRPKGAGKIGFALIDVTTGAFELTELSDFDSLKQELTRIQPAEIIIPDYFSYDFLQENFGEESALIVKLDALYFDDGKNVLLNHFNVLSLDGFGCEQLTFAVAAAGAALKYVQENLPEASLEHIRSLRVFNRHNFLVLDNISARNLELTRSMRDGSTKGTLLEALDNTITASGGRLLRNWINSPLVDIKEIRRRQDAIEAISLSQSIIPEIRDTFKCVADIERLTSRLSTGYGTPRDLAALRASLQTAPLLRSFLQEIINADAAQFLIKNDDQNSLLNEIKNNLTEMPELKSLLENAVVDDPPLKSQDGGIIKEGYNTDLDELRSLSKNGKDWIAQQQIAEAARTGIKSLKIGFNKVFGYYIEVTKTNLHLVPDDYIRKQTIANGERFITQELKEMEAKILNADEKSKQLEFDLFQQLRLRVAAENAELQKIANAIATFDALQNLAWIALQRNFCKPKINDSDALEIIAGRHPVVELLLPNQQFVPNDCSLNTTDSQIVVLTGPNMSGKSTYIRQVAILTIMAQMGSFIPAESAEIGIVDRIFTRVGASDELTRGQSTFMVEMSETANILNNATNKSLIILDEIGRGTSTYDGLSIAWSVIEYLHNCPEVKAKTLFATHYHELVQLEEQLSGIVNYNVAVKEYAGKVVFLHEIVHGGTDKSYGIHVAQLAGIPAPVIERAKEILRHLESSHEAKAAPEVKANYHRPPKEEREIVCNFETSAREKENTTEKLTETFSNEVIEEVEQEKENEVEEEDLDQQLTLF